MSLSVEDRILQLYKIFTKYLKIIPGRKYTTYDQSRMWYLHQNSTLSQEQIGHFVKGANKSVVCKYLSKIRNTIIEYGEKNNINDLDSQIEQFLDVIIEESNQLFKENESLGKELGYTPYISIDGTYIEIPKFSNMSLESNKQVIEAEVNKNPYESEKIYSGKHKINALNSTVLATPLSGKIISITEPVTGSTHDMDAYKNGIKDICNKYNIKTLGDNGYQNSDDPNMIFIKSLNKRGRKKKKKDGNKICFCDYDKYSEIEDKNLIYCSPKCKTHEDMLLQQSTIKEMNKLLSSKSRYKVERAISFFKQGILKGRMRLRLKNCFKMVKAIQIIFFMMQAL